LTARYQVLLIAQTASLQSELEVSRRTIRDIQIQSGSVDTKLIETFSDKTCSYFTMNRLSHRDYC
jgi:hypothetical protein